MKVKRVRKKLVKGSKVTGKTFEWNKTKTFGIDRTYSKRDAKISETVNKKCNEGKLPFLQRGKIVWKSKNKAIEEKLIPAPVVTPKAVPITGPDYIPLSKDKARQAELETLYLAYREVRQLEDNVDKLLKDRINLVIDKHTMHEKIKALCAECANYEAMWAVKIVKFFRNLFGN